MFGVKTRIRALQQSAGLLDPKWQTEHIVALPTEEVGVLINCAQRNYLLFSRASLQLMLIGLSGFIVSLGMEAFFLSENTELSLATTVPAVCAIGFLILITLSLVTYFFVVAEYFSLYYAMRALLADRVRDDSTS